MRYRPTTRAFTLIELLVVISIIALLVSILLPALGSARQAAIQVQCLAGIRSIGQSLAQYQADHQQYYPIGHNGGGWTGSQTTARRYWHEALASYLGLEPNEIASQQAFDIWHCPATAEGWRVGRASQNGMYGPNPNLMGYIDAGGNAVASYFNAAHLDKQVINEVDITEAPSATVLSMDAINPRNWLPPVNSSITAGLTHWNFTHFSSVALDWANASMFRYDFTGTTGLANAVFMDGHAGGHTVDHFVVGAVGNESFLVTSP